MPIKMVKCGICGKKITKRKSVSIGVTRVCQEHTERIEEYRRKRTVVLAKCPNGCPPGSIDNPSCFYFDVLDIPYENGGFPQYTCKLCHGSGILIKTANDEQLRAFTSQKEMDFLLKRLTFTSSSQIHLWIEGIEALRTH